MDDRSIGGPKMFTFDLLATMGAKTSFMLYDGPVRSTLATKAPNGRKDF